VREERGERGVIKRSDKEERGERRGKGEREE